MWKKCVEFCQVGDFRTTGTIGKLNKHSISNRSGTGISPPNFLLNLSKRSWSDKENTREKKRRLQAEGNKENKTFYK